MKWLATLLLGIVCAAPAVGQQERFALPIEIVAAPSPMDDPAGDARDIADLVAQQQMASWAQWMFWATMASVVVSALALFGLLTSLRQTAAAIKDNRQVGEATAQAYVHAVEAEFGSSLNILVSLMNSGSSPATHFSVAGTARLIPRGEVTDAIGFTNGPFKTFSALGAGETLTVGIGPYSVISDFRQGTTPEDQILLICGQVIYCTIFNHDHETQFAFYVDPLDRRRFRRPTSNIRAFWRVPKEGLPVATLIDPSATRPTSESDG